MLPSQGAQADVHDLKGIDERDEEQQRMYALQLPWLRALLASSNPLAALSVAPESVECLAWLNPPPQWHLLWRAGSQMDLTCHLQQLLDCLLPAINGPVERSCKQIASWVAQI